MLQLTILTPELHTEFLSAQGTPPATAMLNRFFIFKKSIIRRRTASHLKTYSTTKILIPGSAGTLRYSRKLVSGECDEVRKEL